MKPLARALGLLESRFRDFEGPLTGELVLKPGAFGLGQVPVRHAPDRTTGMICGFCSTGCSLNVHLRNGEATNLTPAVDHPVNLGMACPKGWESLAPLAAPDRGTVPLIRGARGATMEAADWAAAAGTFRDRFRAILDRHGPESVAFLSTGQICNEEMALLGAFAKFGMGVIHGDGNTRQCMATAVRAYKESFGFDAPPYTYADFEESDVIVLVGSNLCITHPILWQRVLRNRRNPEIVVIDPRRTETAMQATRHLAIRPKSDLAFFYGIARILLDRGRVDRDYIGRHTTGFAAFAGHLADFGAPTVAALSGIDEEELESLAELIGGGGRVSFWWTMGVNQGHEATRTAQAIINLALMTGNLGKPGTGANSITGQCNAMGSRLYSNTTNLIGGHDFTNPAHRAKVAAALGVPLERIPDRESLPYHRIIEGVREGEIKGLWIIATNPAHSWIGRDDFREVMDRLEFLVVQDMYPGTETAQLADLYLPAAGWGEKDGTFINSERRLGIVKKVAKAPGQALSDFNIFRLLSETWGCGDWIREWSSPEAVFRLLQRACLDQPCDISGIDGFREIDEAGGVQWPKPAPGPVEPERRLFEGGRFFTSDGRACFVFDAIAPDPEPPCEAYPLRLLTGRGSSAQWHTQTRTKKSGVLRRLAPSANFLEIHPKDAEGLRILSGETVRVTSRRGTIEVAAFVAATVPEGSVFLPMHEDATNLLTLAVFDTHSHQPSYKSCAVKVEAVR